MNTKFFLYVPNSACMQRTRKDSSSMFSVVQSDGMAPPSSRDSFLYVLELLEPGVGAYVYFILHPLNLPLSSS